jgi:hypothetical protein
MTASGAALVSGLDDGVGTGSGSDDPSEVFGTCRLLVDGTQIGGDHVFRMTDDGQRDVFSLIAVTPAALLAGAHPVTLRCFENDGDIDWEGIQLSVVALAAE